MKVLVIGASGLAGKEVTKALLNKGYKVRAITRSTSSIGTAHPNLQVLEGNILNPVFIREALQGQDAVINCLGIGGKGNGKTNTLISDSTKILVSAMKDSSAQRLIAMSNVGAGDSATFHPWIFRKVILPYFMKWLKVIIEDKNRMEPIISESNLDWTIVRCPNITEKPSKGTVHATLDGKGLKLSVTNEDLAQFMVAQLNDKTYLHQSPSISN